MEVAVEVAAAVVAVAVAVAVEVEVGVVAAAAVAAAKAVSAHLYGAVPPFYSANVSSRSMNSARGSRGMYC